MSTPTTPARTVGMPSDMLAGAAARPSWRWLGGVLGLGRSSPRPAEPDAVNGMRISRKTSIDTRKPSEDQDDADELAQLRTTRSVEPALTP